MTKRAGGAQLNLGVKSDVTALYVRVSTEKQAEEGFSLDAQRERLQAYCKAQGWTVIANHIYIDAGISGKSTADRAAFQAMISAAQHGEITRIVALKLDRLARNVRDFLGIVDSLSSVGCGLVLIMESFDTSTPHGKFALTMFAAMAELEAATISERMDMGRREKAAQGGYNGAQCPLGYLYANTVFTVEPAQAETVKTVFRWFVDGLSMSTIATRLNDANATTARGGEWHASTIKYILSNGFYAGLAQWNDSEVAGSHPAIIDRRLYEAAHRRLVSLRPGPQLRGSRYRR
jgi:site-specific DNA recombinase